MRNKTTAIFLLLLLLFSMPATAESRQDEAHRYYAVGPLWEGFTWVVQTDENAADPWEEGIMYIIDIHGNRLTNDTLKVSNRYFSEGLVTVWKDGKAGCIDTEGNVAVPFAFDDIYEFNNGTAIAQLGEKRGLIDRDGNWILPCEWDDISVCRHSDASLYYTRKGEKYGLVNASGKIVYPCEMTYMPYFGFQDGLMLIQTEQGFGYVNKDGKIAIPCQWYSALDFKGGLARVYTGEAFGFIDTAGELLFTLPKEWTIVGRSEVYFQDGLLRVINSERQYGCVDTSGRLVIPFQDWEDVGVFSEGMAAVVREGKYGFIDKTGREVVSCQWDRAYPYHQGYAWVMKDGKYQVIDREGKLAATVGNTQISFDMDGMYQVYEILDGKIRYGLRRYDGSLVTDCQWDFISYSSSYDGIIEVGQQDPQCQERYGYLNLAGAVVIPCEYDRGYYSNGYFTLIRNGYLTILDREGNIVF